MAKRISSLSVILGASAAPFVSAFGKAGDVADAVRSKIAGVGSALVSITGITAIVGAAWGALKGIGSGIGLAAELEQTGVAFETMLGSGAAAKGLMDDLTKFSAATPFEFPEIANSAKKLLAFGVGASDMTKKLTMLGDIAAGIGAPLEDIAAIYGKIKSRGQLTGETLNQMAERGIPIYRALAAQMNVSESAVAGLVTAGKIGFRDVDAALGALSGTGGQFSGMMEKQSHTLAGLWSTFTDTIGLAMAGFVTTVVQAFHLREALAGLSGFLGTASTYLNDALARFAPMIFDMAAGVWNAITAAWSAIYNFVAPIVSSLAAWIGDHWQQIVSGVASRLSAMWGIVQGAFTGIWSIITSAGTAIAQTWSAVMHALGYDSLAAGMTAGQAFQTIGSWLLWLEGIANVALVTVGFAFGHFTDIVSLVAVDVILALVRIGNQIEYVFGTVAPTLAQWLWDNWRDIFTTMASFTAAIFIGMAKNVGNFFSAIWSWMKGDGFNFTWEPLTSGFESAIKELPKIAERELGPLEQGLQAESDRLADSLGGGLAQALENNKQVGKDATASLQSAFDKIPPEIAPEITVPKFDAPKLDADTAPADAKIKATKDSVKDLGNVAFGSAEMLARMAGARSFSGDIATQPAAPIDTKTQTAMREAGRANDTAAGGPAWQTTALGYLKTIADAAKQKTGTLEVEEF